MHDNNLSSSIANATKWSAITNTLRKLISPFVNMILARLLAPDVFGVVATVNIIISFAEMLSDAGFSKYIVQCEFEDTESLFQSANVAFWSNFFISTILWFGIIVFRDPLARLVGSPGYGVYLAVAACSIPIVSLSSIQQALFRREFNFKGLLFPRLINSLIPLIVTIPIAYFLRNCWALIIGTLISNISDAVLLTVKSKWKPNMFYRFVILKEMLYFSVWSLLESISIWLSLNLDVFILGRVLPSYYLGLYKTSLTAVNQIITVITTTIIPVLFTSLSRCQSDRNVFLNTFFEFQKKSAVLMFPLSIGIFLYGDVVTWVLLGDQWMEASRFISMIGLVQAFVVLYANFASEVYRSLGQPKISFAVQTVYIISTVPILYASANIGFDVLCYAKAFSRVWFVVIHLVVLQFVYKISVGKMLLNISAPVAASAIMAVFALFARSFGESVAFRLITIIPCIVVYFLACFLFADTRNTIRSVLGYIKKMRIRKGT